MLSTFFVPEHVQLEDYLSSALAFTTPLCSAAFSSAVYHCCLAGLYLNSGLIQKAPLTLTLGLPVTRLACGKFCECWHRERRSMYVFIEF